MKKNKKLILAEVREQHGYTRKRFAEEIGMPLRTIEDIEKRGSATKESLQKFADFFHLPSIDDLFRDITPVKVENPSADSDAGELEKEMAEFIANNDIAPNEAAYQYYKVLISSQFDSTIDFASLLENFENADAEDIDGMTKQQISGFFAQCKINLDESSRTIKKLLSKFLDPDFDISLRKLQTFAIAMREAAFKTESDTLFAEAIYRKKNGTRID